MHRGGSVVRRGGSGRALRVVVMVTSQNAGGNCEPDAPNAGRAAASQPCREPARLAGPCQVPPGRRREPSSLLRLLLLLHCLRPSSQ